MLARSYAGPVWAYQVDRWRGHTLRAEVDDAVQEALVECLKPEGPLERADPLRGDFRGLLLGVVRNVARRFEERAAKAQQRGLDQSVYLDELPHKAEALSRVFDRAWAQSLLREAVQRHEAAAAGGDEGAQHRFRVLQLPHVERLFSRETACVLWPGGRIMVGGQSADPGGANFDPATQDNEPLRMNTVEPFFLARH